MPKAYSVFKQCSQCQCPPVAETHDRRSQPWLIKLSANDP